MGAALLKNPDNLVAILTSLVEDIGKPNGVPISVKIRILETKEETLELVRRLCTTGIARITVHCRTTPMRPVEKVIRDHLVEIVSICHEANVQCYANGDVESREHAENLISEFGVDGCMIARAAETNPSCFRAEGILPWKEVAGEYLKAAIDVNNHTSNTKYVLAQLCPGKSLEYKAVNAGKTMGDFCAALDVPRPASLKEEVPVVGRRNSKAVKKARTESQTVKAAGGSGTRMKAVEKKRSERGVGASIPLVEQHEQAAAAAGVCEI